MSQWDATNSTLSVTVPSTRQQHNVVKYKNMHYVVWKNKKVNTKANAHDEIATNSKNNIMSQLNTGNLS